MADTEKDKDDKSRKRQRKIHTQKIFIERDDTKKERKKEREKERKKERKESE